MVGEVAVISSRVAGVSCIISGRIAVVSCRVTWEGIQIDRTRRSGTVCASSIRTARISSSRIAGMSGRRTTRVSKVGFVERVTWISSRSMRISSKPLQVGVTSGNTPSGTGAATIRSRSIVVISGRAVVVSSGAVVMLTPITRNTLVCDAS